MEVGTKFRNSVQKPGHDDGEVYGIKRIDARKEMSGGIF